MPKITDEALEKVLVRLYAKDLEFLRRLYSDQLGVNRAIRAIIHSFVTQSQAAANAKIDAVESQQQLLTQEDVDVMLGA